MARIDIEIEDYLDEVDTRYLLEELMKRKDFSPDKLKGLGLDLNEIARPNFKTTESVLDYLKFVLRLKPWHGKKEILAEIESL